MSDVTIHEKALQQLKSNLKHIIVGKDAELDMFIVGLLSGGHLLLEDIPGVGKTTLAKALSRSLCGTLRRIQFTPDLLPTDIIGVSIYNPKDSQFHFKPGPIFCNILLADEINRASPRTQSALLEAMGEKQVSVDGATRVLDAPFFVIATQNPIESHGTYPLPEAQLDRFQMRMSLGYPDLDQELQMLTGAGGLSRLHELEKVMDLEQLVELQKEVESVRAEHSVLFYLLTLVKASRNHPSVRLGVSPRGALALLSTARALAFLKGRKFITPQDIKTIAPYTMAHRLVMSTEAKYAGIQPNQVIDEILMKTEVPR